jgi:two-component system, OmpR family, sensor histidine kinase SenX3
VQTVVLVIGIVCIVVGVVLALSVRKRLNDAEDRARRARESGLRELDVAHTARERVIAALHALDDGVIIVGADGAELVRNTAAERFRDARHSDAAAAELIDRLAALALEGEVVERELPLFGPPREVLVIHALPLELDGEPAGAAVIVRDVTEQRRTDSVRRDFVANVSHELKTPIGALALLAETLAATDKPETAKVLSDQMLRETDRLVRIVDDLLDLSLIEAQETPTRDRVPVHVLLEEAVERVRALALAKGMPLRYTAPQHDLSVDCDPTKLLGALTNLLDNAVKYSEEGGAVEVYADRVADRVVITVRDHGIGIPSRDLERIFERFYRVDKARSRSTGGTGLGLAIVRHVAQVHGGEVAVESTEGVGSTFRLTLPVAGAGEREPHVHAEAS